MLFLPVNVDKEPSRRGLAGGTAQRFPLELAAALRALLFGSDFAEHGKNIIQELSICQWTNLVTPYWFADSGDFSLGTLT